MRILVTGATGFIGSALVAALQQRGHELVAWIHSSRVTPFEDMERVQVDYMQDLDVEDWLPRVRDVDVVINTVGILRDSRTATLEALHHLAPKALFAACEQSGVGRVIQVSALGADDQAHSRYHLTKKAADDVLRESGLDWSIVQPSVVFGLQGASTQLFLHLASLPLVPLVGRGDNQLQPIHIDDLVELVVNLVDRREGLAEVIPAVGPEPLSMRNMLATYRKGLGLSPALMLPLPVPLMRLVARIGDVTHIGSLSTETLAMLLRGNTAPGDRIAALLGHSPRSPDALIEAADSSALKLQVIWSWVRPLLLVSLAVMWLASGLVSWFYAHAYGLDLLGSLGLTPSVAEAAFAVSCALNVAIGMATLVWPRRALWFTQLGVMLFYSAALSCAAPQLWLDPFGPLVKNLPVTVILLGLLAAES